MQDTVYTPHRGPRNLVIVCTIAFGGSGITFLLVSGIEVISVVFSALGVLLGAAAFTLIGRRVVVGERGIQKSPRFGGFDVAWDEIESWTVRDVDSDTGGDSWTTREVEMHVQRYRWPLSVSNSEAYSPPFDYFVEQLLARLGPEREVTPGKVR